MAHATRIWPARSRAIVRCFINPGHINTLFHDASFFAEIHDMQLRLELEPGLIRIPFADDPTYALFPWQVRARLDPSRHIPLASWLDLTTHVNGVKGADVASRAVRAGQGLLLAVYEDR